jgi:hypothetical protein
MCTSRAAPGVLCPVRVQEPARDQGDEDITGAVRGGVAEPDVVRAGIQLEVCGASEPVHEPESGIL